MKFLQRLAGILHIKRTVVVTLHGHSFSTYLGNIVLDAYYKNGTPHISLHTASPGVTGANEVTGGSYARAAGTYGTAVNKISKNTNALVYTDMPACTVTHAGSWDALSGGNFLIGGVMTASKTLNAGDTFQMNAEACPAQID